MEKTVLDVLTWALGRPVAEAAAPWVTVLCIGVSAWLLYWVCVKLLIPLVDLLTRKTETEWDDDLLNANVLKAASQLAPAIWVSVMLPDMFVTHVTLFAWLERLTRLYILWAAVHLILVVLRSVQEALDKRHLLKRANLEIVRQTIGLFVIIVAVVIGIGIIINRSPGAIFTALGASAAVLMLVFQGTILNFVAGVQLTVNKMIERGNWIVAPKAGINGEVIDIKLTIVKVRNWDNSIVTIQPSTLFSESFQNFQAMKLSGGRRVSRSVLIDADTVRFLNDSDIARLKSAGLLEGIEDKVTQPVVNLTLLRHYMEHFVSHYPEVINNNPAMLYMARQLQPTAQGIPFELYFFTTRTDWKPYEHLQSDIFDHLYAVVPQFGLRIYQAPSGLDLRSLQPSNS